jgi:outer membrane lipoprotein LolB
MNTLQRWRLWLVLSLLATLAACSTPTLKPKADTAQTQAFWSGRLSLKIDGTPPKSLSASFELLGNAQQGELLLLSPLGTTLGRLQWQPGQARLDQGEQHWQDSSVQALTEQLTGAPVPLEALFEWLKGHPASSQGWQVDLRQWSSHARLQAERKQPEPYALLKLHLDR